MIGACSKRNDLAGNACSQQARECTGCRTPGPRQTIGELGLLDGAGHSLNVRVTESASVLALPRLDFAALLAGQRRSTFRLQRQLASLPVMGSRGTARR